MPICSKDLVTNISIFYVPTIYETGMKNIDI